MIRGAGPTVSAAIIMDADTANVDAPSASFSDM